MTERQTPRTVLIVDRDLGFVFWLGRLLEGAGMQALPAKSVEDGAALLEEFRVAPDILVIEPEVPGAAGFVERQQRLYGCKVIAAVSKEEGGTPLERAQVWLVKPSHGDEVADFEWLNAIRSLLAASAVRQSGC